jgi:hypothetical protein
MLFAQKSITNKMLFEKVHSLFILVVGVEDEYESFFFFFDNVLS